MKNIYLRKNSSLSYNELFFIYLIRSDNMKKTVPLKKELNFKNHLAEIVSIALDHELNLEDRVIKGNLIISGSYKINDTSVNTEQFKFNIPVNIEMSDRYNLENMNIDIDDFYYEIINNNILSVSIEIGLDNLEETLPPFKYEKEKVEAVVKEEDKEELSRIDTNDVKNLFDSFDDSSETYSTYHVCIVKESDTIESIILKYNISKEVLEQYNDISDIKIGDKLIIPSIYETN